MSIGQHGCPISKKYTVNTYVFVNLLFGVWPPCCAPPLPCVRAHEAIPLAMITMRKSTHGIPLVSVPIWVWGSACLPFGPPELRYYYYDRFYLLLCISLLHQLADFKSMLVDYINLHSFFRLNKFVEFLTDIYILAQNPFLTVPCHCS